MENQEMQTPNNTQNVAKKFNVLGMISFIASLVGILVAGLPCGIVATITGIIGLVKFNAQTEKGKWMAITGLVIGVLEIVIMGLFMGLLVSAL